jgi:hypothetical protein
MVIGGIFRYLSGTMFRKCKNSIELQIDDNIHNLDFGTNNGTIISLFNQGYESTLSYFVEKILKRTFLRRFFIFFVFTFYVFHIFMLF